MLKIYTKKHNISAYFRRLLAVPRLQAHPQLESRLVSDAGILGFNAEGRPFQLFSRSRSREAAFVCEGFF